MFETFDKFLVQDNVSTDIPRFVLNLLFCVLYTKILTLCYNKYGSSFSNREHFSKNFFMISLTTMFVIAVIKQSLALSLGLVGALSIIRFRTAVKDPEELANLFFAISIGIGLGANQLEITSISFVIIIIVMILSSKSRNRSISASNIFLTITSNNLMEFHFGKILKVLKKFSTFIKLKRMEETENEYECTFMLDLRNNKDLESLKKELKLIDNKSSITFFESPIY